MESAAVGDDGRVTIAGYYEGVKLTEAERAIMAAVPDNEGELRKRLGIEKGANIIPSSATAELDLRTTPGASPSYLVGLVEAHIRSKGYHLAKGNPTDEEREQHDKMASLTVARGSAAAFTQLDSPIGAWAQASLARTFATGNEPAKTVRIRMMGGSVPTDKLVEALELPFVIVPLVNADNNQHSFDENLRLGHFLDGIHAFAGMLRTPY
jgi:acetylornithine deacetylase/succinyl-diaminopimelate desuccinylase-like protein